MAVIQERITVGEHDMIYTYSDDDRYVVGGEPHGNYVEAYDPVEFGRTYTEGERMTDEEIEASAEELLNILTGEVTA